MRPKVLQSIVVAAASCVLALGLWRVGALDSIENTTWMWRVRSLAQPSPATSKIKLILLDQASLDWGARENGWPWPWPRQVYSALLDFVARGAPKAIGFDVLYTEPSAYDVADDEAFGNAIARGAPFVGAVFLGRETTQTTAWPGGLARPAPWLGGLDAWLTPANAERLSFPAAAFPIAQLATNADVLATVDATGDLDDVIRRISLFGLFDGVAVPGLGVAMALAGNPAAAASIEPGWFRLGAMRLPLDAAGRAILRYRGPSGTHEAFSAAAVIQSELRLRAGETPPLDPAVFRDAYVLFGFSAPGLKDLRPTPISGNYPGVEIHATLLDNLLHSDAIRDAPPAWIAAFTILLALAGAAGVIASRNAAQAVGVIVPVMALPVVAGFFGYAQGWWWPIAVAELGAVLSLTAGLIVSYATEGRQKRFIKSAFKQYLGEAVIDEMIADPSRLRLGGEKKDLTMFFSDLEKFSSFSEKLEPTQLIDLLNVYLSDVGRVIMEEGGYLDKFIGDAIVAFWNAPLPQADHAARAIRAALRCQRLLRERQADLSALAAGMPVRMRIGINTGPVVVGNMGSADRFNYTMLGDNANLASRLEGSNKAFGTFILVAEATWRAAGETARGRELGAIRVVGRSAPVRVFEPLVLPGEEIPAWVADFERGLALCKQKDWKGALGVFSAIEGDAASAAYVKKLRGLVEGTEKDWDGVWSLTEK